MRETDLHELSLKCLAYRVSPWHFQVKVLTQVAGAQKDHSWSIITTAGLGKMNKWLFRYREMHRASRV